MSTRAPLTRARRPGERRGTSIRSSGGSSENDGCPQDQGARARPSFSSAIRGRHPPDLRTLPRRRRRPRFAFRPPDAPTPPAPSQWSNEEEGTWRTTGRRNTKVETDPMMMPRTILWRTKDGRLSTPLRERSSSRRSAPSQPCSLPIGTSEPSSMWLCCRGRSLSVASMWLSELLYLQMAHHP